MTYDDAVKRVIHIESEEDLEDSPFTYYLDVDIGDTVYICEDADVYMREDKNGWVIFWHNKFMEHIPLSLLDRDDEEAYTSKYRQAQNRYKAYCNAALDGTLEKEFSGNKNRKPSFDYSNASEVFKQFGENTKIDKEQFFECLLNEANIEVYPQDGKLQARSIGQQVVSSKTHNKTSNLDVKAVSQPLTRTQLDGTKAVIAYLKSQNKLNDISTQFDTDPNPDIVFNGAGDAIITPDGGKGRPYTIPAEKLEPFYENKTALFEKLLEE
jgi:hypothetical protein